ncbi:hypothetical protein MKW92_008425 [Papaver armeniacum]|nr:hypothetical protein MKW92_008425 [Papaver armeniacum]
MGLATRNSAGFFHVILLFLIGRTSGVIPEIRSQTGVEIIRPGDIYRGALRNLVEITGSEICKSGDIYDAVLCGPTDDCGGKLCMLCKVV